MPTEGAIRGMGNVYQRGHVWWVRYWHRGEQVRESSKSPDRRIAVRCNGRDDLVDDLRDGAVVARTLMLARGGFQGLQGTLFRGVTTYA